MEHFDEEILKAQNKAKAEEEARLAEEKARHAKEVIEEEKQQSIYDDVVSIFQVPTKFAEQPVLNEKATLRLPVDFTPRSQEVIKLVFPFGNPPQELYGTDDSYFIVALNWTANAMTEQDLPEFLTFSKQTLERMGPKAHIIKTDIKKTEQQTMGTMEMVANAFNGVSYSYIFYTILEERLLMGTVLFDREYADRLLPLASEIAGSFHLTEEGETSK